jgi:hypothetical protein
MSPEHVYVRLIVAKTVAEFLKQRSNITCVSWDIKLRRKSKVQRYLFQKF